MRFGTEAMATVVLGLGGNLGDREEALRRAVLALARALRVRVVSSLYESAPMYVEDQPPFLNMALVAETALDPAALLALVKGLEAALGRTPGRRFGPRLVDIDILFYGDAVLSLPDLEIPHPRLAERAFVLRPLAEIVPEYRHPRLGVTVAVLSAVLPGHGGVVHRPEPRPAQWLAEVA